MRFTEHNETALNANSTATVTAGLEIINSWYVGFQVIGLTGTHTTHVFTLQESADDVDADYTNIASATVTGAGIKDNVQVTMRFVRLKCTTAEGVAATVRAVIQAK